VRRVLAALLLASISLARAGDTPSEAEERLFLAEHLANVNPHDVINYRFVRSGSKETPFEDIVQLALGPSMTEQGKAAHVEFLKGERAITLPDIEAATANPVILSFLERDIREMQRLTGGQPAYFRKRIRMALADGAQVTPLRIEAQDGQHDAWQIEVHPYDADPMRARIGIYADKTYRFTLSPQIPGGVYELHTLIAHRSGGDVPLIEERLTFVGVER